MSLLELVPSGGACVSKFGDEMDFPADEKLSGPDCDNMIAKALTSELHLATHEVFEVLKSDSNDCLQPLI